MDTSIVVAIITSLIALTGTIITVNAGNQKISQQILAHNKVQDERLQNLNNRIDELRAEVHENNNLKIRVPVLEEKVKHLEQQLEVKS